MIRKKQGMPHEGELVMCTVSNIHFNSVFVNLDEYEDKKAMLHISEVSPGRIRNLRDYVREGKVIVCVILKINKERGLIDVSLRRVNDAQRRSKLGEIKQEQMAEKIIERAAKDLKQDFMKVYNEVADKLYKEYDSLYDCFEEVALNGVQLSKFGIRPEIDEALTLLVKQRIKQQEVNVGGKLTISTYESDGVSILKEILANAIKLDEKAISIKYMGAGVYRLNIVSGDYKIGEKLLDKVITHVEKGIKKYNGTFAFERMQVDA
ncbi:MAG: S1 RNA-binding domain-containing protein [Candidatus Woesearchaeota archaeon]